VTSQTKITGSLFPALGLLVLLFLPSRLIAQIDRGEITGTVEDPAGAVVRNANIILTNDATGVSAATKSTATGTYVFDNLIPGTYSIMTESSGFEKYVVNGINVHVQQVLTVDCHLATGSTQQSVTVTAAAPLLQTENAAVGQTIVNQELNDLPLEGLRRMRAALRALTFP
jgi:hypothetical protein